MQKDQRQLLAFRAINGRFDVMAWPGFAVLRRLRELKLVTSLVPVLASRPVLQPEWRRRLETYRNEDEDARWSTYVRAS